MFITLITPTGGRPEAFALCEKYMARQTRLKIESHSAQWIVVDDGEPRTDVTDGQTYVRATELWEEGVNTHRSNMNQALKWVSKDSEAIFIIEDDDWYAPTYLESMIQLLRLAPLVGSGLARYYNLPSQGYMTNPNIGHSSLSQTAIRVTHTRLLYEAVNSGEFYFDTQLWKKAAELKVPRILTHDTGLCVGMKGMPGRGGLGKGHQAKGFMFDPEFACLKEWVGEEDAKEYTQYTKCSIVK